VNLKIASIAMVNEAIYVSGRLKDFDAGFNGSGLDAMILAF
jgi:hypothetical protein